MKEDLIEEIRGELQNLVNHVLQAKDAARIMGLVRKLNEDNKLGKD
jgi:hypothetical protein